MKGASEEKDEDGWKREGGQKQTEDGLKEDVELAASRKGRMEGSDTDWLEKKRGTECLRDITERARELAHAHKRAWQSDMA